MIPTNLGSMSDSELNELFSQVTEREAEILRMRFGLNGEPMNLAYVADVLNTTREDIRRTELQAMVKLGWIAVIE